MVINSKYNLLMITINVQNLFSYFLALLNRKKLIIKNALIDHISNNEIKYSKE